MRIKLCINDEEVIVTQDSKKYYLYQYENSLQLELDPDEIVKISMNNSSYEVDQSISLPIELDAKGSCNVKISSQQENIRLSFELKYTDGISKDAVENIQYFGDRLIERFTNETVYSVNNLLDSIKRNEISLLNVREPITGYDNEQLLHQIKTTLPMILDICSHPKQSLRVEEAVLDVSLVKRMNSNTMKHLASHSEHWKARTLNNLIPSRLKADIFEDEINIYENLFFKMAVDDVVEFALRQDRRLLEVIKQNNSAIDWNLYGNKLNDYQRIKIIQSLLPDFDSDDKEIENMTLSELEKEWNQCVRKLSNIQASQFYRSLNRKKRISRNIHLTNILKNDSRYHALYMLWSEVQREKVKEAKAQQGINGDIQGSLRTYYCNYVFVLAIYALDVMGTVFDENSKFFISDDGELFVDALSRDEKIVVSYKTIKDENGYLRLKVEYQERLNIVMDVSSCSIMLEDFEEFKELLTADVEKEKLIFHRRPTEEEKTRLEKLYQLSKSMSKGMDADMIRRRKSNDHVWRANLEQFVVSKQLRNPRVKTLLIVPQFCSVAKEEKAVLHYTEKTFDSIETDTIFTLPIDIEKYRKCTDEIGISRLLGYGESFKEEDAVRWGEYKKGLLPISQSELSSMQRIIKMFTIQKTKLLLQWEKAKQNCPICDGNVKEFDANTCVCLNEGCNIIYGKTKCRDGCGQYFDWTRPSLDLDVDDIKDDNEVDLILSKENIFDRLIITDFIFIPEQGKLKYNPVCPICGK